MEKEIREVLIESKGCTIGTLCEKLTKGPLPIYNTLEELVKENKVTKVVESGQPNKFFNVQEQWL